ncbi:MAG TPA: hypothetical protein VIK30_10915 [Polyangia bacterium]
MLRLILATLAVVALIIRPAAAQAERDDEPRRRDTAIYFLAGAGTPVGFAGFEGVHRLGARLEVSAGVGAGASAGNSEMNPSLGHVLQWALMPRLRMGDDHDVLTIGVGISGGDFGNTLAFDGCDSNTPCAESRYVVWANVEAGGEHWLNSGFAVRYFAGYAHGFASGDSFNIPYFGFGLGYAF